MTLREEIFEQPQVLNNLLAGQWSTVAEVAHAISRRKFSYIYLAARGTSDNAGRYAQYLFGGMNQMPVALAAPSLFTWYDKPPRLSGALVIGISQSGQSPDIVQVLAEANRQGCTTLAITNNPASPLAKTAEFKIDIMAGIESAVAATKTYTSELMSLAMLSAALRAGPDMKRELEVIPEQVAIALGLEEAARQAAASFAKMQRGVALGRGYHYATAYEWALKLKELTYVLTEPYSGADFEHGPVAMVEPNFPVLAVTTSGKLFENTLDLLRRLKTEQDARTVVISDEPAALQYAQYPLALPAGIADWLSPLVAIIPGQLFAYHLALARGLNPETPRHIHKVTETE